MKINFFKNLCLLIIVFCSHWSEWAMACMGEPSLAKLRDRVRIIAPAQYGLRLEGKHAVPELMSVEPAHETKVALKVVGQATGFKDSRSLWERVSGKISQYETFLIPKTLELIPESNSENTLRYTVKIKDGPELLSIELLFEGGAQKTLRGGCGGGKAQIESL